MTARRHRKFERDYSPAELEMFADYVRYRAAHKPPQCTEGEHCWVRCGPPSYRIVGGHNGYCVECKGAVQ
jgi:hypothetical protein